MEMDLTAQIHRHIHTYMRHRNSRTFSRELTLENIHLF